MKVFRRGSTSTERTSRAVGAGPTQAPPPPQQVTEPDPGVWDGRAASAEAPPQVSSTPLAPKKESPARPTPVSTLGNLQLPARFDSAEVKLDLPLEAGLWSLPFGDKTAVIEVPEGCSLHVEAQVDGKGEQPTLTGASMKASQPLKVKNAEDLVDLGIPLSNLAGKVVGSVVDVQLSALKVEADGRLVPELALVVPDVNPLHLMRGQTSRVQRVPLIKALMPKVNTDARGLLAGDLFPDKYSQRLAKTVQPRGLDLKAVLGGIGAMSGEGHVELKLRTELGDVAVGQGAIGVRHDASPMELKVSGDFLVSHHGELSSQLTGEVDTALVDSSFTAKVDARATPTGIHGSVEATATVSSEPGGKIRVDSGDGKLSVGHGAFTATHSGDAVQVSLGGKLLELAQGIGGAMKVKLGSDVSAQLNAEVSAGADFGLDLTPDGVAVRAGDARAAVTSGGVSLAAPTYDVVLGAGSQLRMEAGELTYDPTRGLSVTDTEGRFQLNLPRGRIKQGPFSGAVSGQGGQFEGRIQLEPAAAGGPRVQAQADGRITGRGGLGRFLVPVDVTVNRRLAVTLGADGVDVRKLDR